MLFKCAGFGEAGKQTHKIHYKSAMEKYRVERRKRRHNCIRVLLITQRTMQKIIFCWSRKKSLGGVQGKHQKQVAILKCHKWRFYVLSASEFSKISVRPKNSGNKTSISQKRSFLLLVVNPEIKMVE